MVHQNQPPQKYFYSLVLIICLQTNLNEIGEKREMRER